MTKMTFAKLALAAAIGLSAGIVYAELAPGAAPGSEAAVQHQREADAKPPGDGGPGGPHGPHHGEPVKVDGIVKSLNFDPRGHIDGATLESGDFLFIGIQALDLKLEPGAKLKVEGLQSILPSGVHHLIHATKINEVEIAPPHHEGGPEGRHHEGGPGREGPGREGPGPGGEEHHRHMGPPHGGPQDGGPRERGDRQGPPHGRPGGPPQGEARPEGGPPPRDGKDAPPPPPKPQGETDNEQ